MFSLDKNSIMLFFWIFFNYFPFRFLSYRLLCIALLILRVLVFLNVKWILLLSLHFDSNAHLLLTLQLNFKLLDMVVLLKLNEISLIYVHVFIHVFIWILFQFSIFARLLIHFVILQQIYLIYAGSLKIIVCNQLF
jgi:hypothetical protein